MKLEHFLQQHLLFSKKWEDKDLYVYHFPYLCHPKFCKEIWQRMLPVIEKNFSEWEDRQFRRKEDAVRHYFSHILLKKHLSQKLSIKEEDVRYTKGKYHKPYLKEGDLQFNLSHSASYIAIGLSKRPVGVDVEEILNKEKLFFSTGLWSKEEEEAILASKDQEGEFTRFWTLKESYLKALGTGFFQEDFPIFFRKKGILQCSLPLQNLFSYRILGAFVAMIEL
ncbi:4'-phosphopantetheinyl transferase family protein [Oribacterium sinus]|uniref:4'-phosphopantetheinyl transferase family protein n=1 Tax=Oribacterium sinus TaxID=237576 RepID=UPI0028E39B4F|nr:4'-phosphopantetheinyl transferase superfamily protein [Oribacterium sinus]